MKQPIGVAAPVLVATAACLVLYAIGVAARLYEGEQIRGMLLEAPLVVVGGILGAGVGTLICRGVMRHRSSMGWRCISAVVSLVLTWVLAWISTCVAGLVGANADHAIGMALCVAAPTSLVFGFTGGAFEKQIPAKSDSRPLTP